VSYLRILVVEDHASVRRFVCSLLQEKAEFVVIAEAADGAEAVHLARQLQPDVILIDIGLPRLNGMDAARQIRIVAPHARLLFLSLESSHDVVREALRIGAHGYVHKQSAQNELVRAVEQVLGGKQYVSSDLRFGESMNAYTRHEIQFYSDEAVYLESVTPFIAGALKADGKRNLHFTGYGGHTLKNHAERLAGLRRVMGRPD
jgi:DNA-binding NarL/FixJ family response regulator